MLSLALVIACQTPQQYKTTYHPSGPVIVATIENRGSFEITTDPKTSPKTVARVIELVNSKFYDSQRFHRVEWWVTQWGAPKSKTMDINSMEVRGGGSGKQLPFEQAEVDFYRGVVGVASTGFQVGGDSQLFILKHDWERLWHCYAVVGKVTSGMSVVDSIQKGDRITSMKVKRR
jgi:peptidyl-prolyl cis-trans isomerase B (cyclophilin B)